MTPAGLVTKDEGSRRHALWRRWSRGPMLAVMAVLATLAPASSASATHQPPTGAVALPAPPAVLDFRGGANAFNGTHWGGHAGFDGTCEGTIRQALGLLDARGEAIPVPAAQRIMVGGNVVGIRNAAGTYRAYNLDVTTFATAFGALQANDSLYSCAHGARAANGAKGGVLLLDSGTRFDGFASATFMNGTDASPAPAYAALAAPPGNVNAHLHHCMSGADPDGAANVMHSVAETLDVIPNVTIAHAHPNLARSTYRIASEDGPAPGANTVAQRNATLPAAQAAIRQAAFPGRYAAGQAAIDAALPPVNGQQQLLLHITYADTGDTGDPPGEQNDLGCAVEEDVFRGSRGVLTLETPFGPQVITLDGTATHHVDFDTLRDSDSDSREQVETDMAELDLSGTGPTGPVVVRLRDPGKSPFQRSKGEHEEASNQMSGRLDVPPFAPSGTADSFFDVFFEIQFQSPPPGCSALMHNEQGLVINGQLRRKPPDEDDFYDGPGTVPLYDESGNPTGCSGRLRHTPYPNRPPTFELVGNRTETTTCNGTSTNVVAAMTGIAQDEGTGLASIVLNPASQNVTLHVPPFSPGTQDPVIVTANKIDKCKPARVDLTVTDRHGKTTRADPMDVTLLVRRDGRPLRVVLTDIPQAESKIELMNGDPGLSKVLITVNKKQFALRRLQNGERRTLDVARAMRARGNTITFRPRGRPGASAIAIVHD